MSSLMSHFVSLPEKGGQKSLEMQGKRQIEEEGGKANDSAETEEILR